MDRPWFVGKRYGIGLRPVSRAGWVATTAVAVLILLLALVAHGNIDLLLAGLALIVLLFVPFSIWKSDRQPWRFRWGGR